MPEMYEPFGSWMLAAKKPRRGRQTNGRIATGEKEDRHRGKEAITLTGPRNILGATRFDILGMEEGEDVEVQENTDRNNESSLQRQGKGLMEMDDLEHHGDTPDDSEFLMEDDGIPDWATSKGFLRAAKHMIKNFKPLLLCLLESKISGNQADQVCRKLAFDQWVHDDKQRDWYLACVYGSPSLHLRNKLWDDLGRHKRGIDGPWLVLGDFNAVSCREEVSNPTSFSDSRFNKWLDTKGLVDVGFTSPKFTWTRGNSVETFKGVWLDRAVCSTDFLDIFPGIHAHHLVSSHSNHVCLLVRLEQNTRTRSKGRFVFNAAWTVQENFNEVVGLNWDPKANLKTNLQQTAKALIDWSKNGLGTTFKRKSRVQIKTMVREYYVHLFSKDHISIWSKCPINSFPEINLDTWRDLYKDCTTEEVKSAMFEMAPFKAPGPDGFHADFFQKAWAIVGNHLTTYTRDFLNTGIIPEGLNDRLVALIPKIKHLDKLSHFRPISLCNVIYKLITKILTNRIKGIVREAIGPEQSSFVLKRQITDNIMVFQEILQSMKKKTGAVGQMVIKIDLEKAYDRLSWQFIRETLEEVGFRTDWIQKVMQCIETAKLSVLWDGELSVLWDGEQLDWIKPKRGIRQGDPISPYIFVLCMERLSHIIKEATINETCRGIKISRYGPTLTHLFFVDDMVLFAEATEEQERW
ncbi:uncharacterized protein LOC115996111 [Ipomoea triloba]|uniref:uncharacterized protein LOC115996111 n=1 Tax=Ipomoea triloba TaxID=35885 RepID=UPI00125E5C76|nr:uncharacterized protein LOC115996111 [Ipomoea triloba]